MTTEVAERVETHVFVSPRRPNTKFLVERGPDGYANELMRKDVFAEFNAGICPTDDPRVIKWLQAHEALVPEEDHAAYHRERHETPTACSNRGFCMDAMNDRVGFWADQEGRKLNLKNRESQLESGYDTEAALRGENPLAGVPGTLIERAQGAMDAAMKSAGPVSTNHPERFHQSAGRQEEDPGEGPPRGEE